MDQLAAVNLLNMKNGWTFEMQFVNLNLAAYLKGFIIVTEMDMIMHRVKFFKGFKVDERFSEQFKKNVKWLCGVELFRLHYDCLARKIDFCKLIR